MDYQRLIKDSDIACGKFVKTSLAALKSHKLALDLAEKDKVSLALKQLAKCAGDAENMIKTSQHLVVLSETLCNEAKQAMQTASSDETTSIAQSNEVRKTLSDFVKREGELSSRTKALQTMINDAREKEVQALKEAQDAEKRNLFLSVIGSIGKVAMTVVTNIPIKIGRTNQPESNPLSVLTNVVQTIFLEKSKIEQELHAAEEQLAVKRVQFETSKSDDIKIKLKEEIAVLELTVRNKQEALKGQSSDLDKAQNNLKAKSDTAAQRASEAGQRKLALQREQLEANADLAGSVAKLKGLKQESNDLSQALTSLDITIKTLGKVKTVFENTRMFWEGVKTHCQSLTESIENCKELAEDPGLRQEFIKTIQTSGYNWLALGQINWTASLAIADVNKGVDDIMNNLPTKPETPRLIELLSNSMLRQIEQERKTLTNLSSN